MNLRNIINNYAECNLFEIKYKNCKLYFYYYDKVNHFSSDKIEIISNKDKYIVTGKNLIIESMHEEEIIINGNIYNINMECTHE